MILVDISAALPMAFKRIYLRFFEVQVSNNCKLQKVRFLGKATIEPYCRICGETEAGITIGNNFYMNAGCHILGEIYIGNDVLIGPKTVIWSRDHQISRSELIRKQPYLDKRIVIGDDVWIGANVTVLKGVEIGNGAVIGGGSVVVNDIPEYAVAVGNPAKVLKYRN